MSTRLHDPHRRGFYSDNTAGAHPEIVAAIIAANEGHQPSYGQDVYTQRLQDIVADQFGAGALGYPMFNGTGTNVVALQAMLPRWGAAICARSAHVNTDENGAPERVGGVKLLPVDTPDGKLTPDLVDRAASGWGDEHRAQPHAVSITQSSEFGTVYTPAEVRAIADHAHRLDMRLHMDGARLANAAAALDVPLAAITCDAGVDVLSLGGTKNGLLFGECLVVLDPAAVDGVPFLRKIDLQLAAKMRFVSAQLVTLLDGDLWRRNAAHANGMATRLRAAIETAAAEGRIRATLTRPTQANAVFVCLDPAVSARLRERFPFEVWDEASGEGRLMCSFDTEDTEISALIAEWSRQS